MHIHAIHVGIKPRESWCRPVARMVNITVLSFWHVVKFGCLLSNVGTAPEHAMQ